MWKLDHVLVQHHIKLAGFQPFDPQLVEKDNPEGVASGTYNFTTIITVFTRVNQHLFILEHSCRQEAWPRKLEHFCLRLPFADPRMNSPWLCLDSYSYSRCQGDSTLHHETSFSNHTCKQEATQGEPMIPILNTVGSFSFAGPR